MREIKFRFVYRGDCQLHYKVYYLDEFETKSLKELSDVHHQMPLISKDECMGQKDKNKQEIYENDIIILRGKKHIVKFLNGCFVYGDSEFNLFYGHEAEVVGNVHEIENNYDNI